MIQNIIPRIMNTIHTNKWLIFGTLIYFAISSTWLLSLHYSFKTNGGDLGQYVQMFWNTINRNGIFSSDLRVRPGNIDGSYFGEHFSPILLLFIPIFYIFPKPETLLIIKTFFISISVPILWIIAKNNLDIKLSKIVVISYILNPFLLRALSFDFQEQFILPFIIFCEFYFYFKRRYILFTFFTILGFNINEYSTILSAPALLGLAISEYKSNGLSFIDTIKEKRIFIPIFLAVLSIIYFFSTTAVMNSYADSGIIVRNVNIVNGGDRISMIGYINLLISNPSYITTLVFNNIQDKILYLNLFLAPTFYLSILSPISFLPLILYTGFGWLVDHYSFYEFDHHHSFYLIPYMYIGLILSIKNINLDYTSINRSISNIPIIISIMLFTIGISSSVDMGLYPTFDEHTRILHDILKTIPDNASILTQNSIHPYLAMRNVAYAIIDPDRFQQLLLTKQKIDVDYIIIDEKITSWKMRWSEIVEQSMDDPEFDFYYGLLMYNDGIYVFKKGYNSNTVEVKNFNEIYSEKDLKLSEGYMSGGILVHPTGYYGKTFWFGPYRLLPPGNYKATFEIRRQSNNFSNNGRLITLDIRKDRGKNVLISEDIYYSDVGNKWTNISLAFKTDYLITNIEFRGINPSPYDDIYLRRIIVKKLDN